MPRINHKGAKAADLADKKPGFEDDVVAGCIGLGFSLRQKIVCREDEESKIYSLAAASSASIVAVSNPNIVF